MYLRGIKGFDWILTYSEYSGSVPPTLRTYDLDEHKYQIKPRKTKKKDIKKIWKKIERMAKDHGIVEEMGGRIDRINIWCYFGYKRVDKE